MFTTSFNKSLFQYQLRNFGKKCSADPKYKTPLMKMKTVKRITPPPGDNLVLPDWTPQQFLRRIGGDCEEYHE